MQPSSECVYLSALSASYGLRLRLASGQIRNSIRMFMRQVPKRASAPRASSGIRELEAQAALLLGVACYVELFTIVNWHAEIVISQHGAS
mmetsp:Transcript_58258/g.126532  ORF Transcript_58258/g.126532 Transcript_58258/m.126532 type:complete len:90 (-) Transcript_58258:1454-1723(-)